MAETSGDEGLREELGINKDGDVLGGSWIGILEPEDMMVMFWRCNELVSCRRIAVRHESPLLWQSGHVFGQVVDFSENCCEWLKALSYCIGGVSKGSELFLTQEHGWSVWLAVVEILPNKKEEQHQVTRGCGVELTWHWLELSNILDWRLYTMRLC